MKETRLEDLIRWRRDLHQYPELSLQEKETSTYIRQQLSQLDIPFVTPMETATIAFIQGNKEANILLRADIDALPIQELNEVDWRSKHDGRMHACGHDGHTAMLLGALKELKVLADKRHLDMSVIAVFQPAEETFGGGNQLIKAYDFSQHEILAAFALHVNPDYPEGTLATRASEIMASSREFQVAIVGKSAHVGIRERGVNAMNAAAQIFQQFQVLPTYDLDAKHTNIVHVGMFKAGEAMNIVPNYANLSGTIRTYSSADLDIIKDRMQKISEGVALATDCQVTLTIGEGYPAVINAPQLLPFSKKATERAGAHFHLQEDPYLMAEDFSFYAKLAPIHYAFVGIRNEDLGYTSGLHTPYLQFREEALVYGVDYLVALVTEFGEDQWKMLD